MATSTAAEVAALRATLEAFMNQQHRDAQDAKDRDTSMVVRLAAVEQGQREFDQTQRELLRRTSDMEPTFQAIQKGKWQAIGALAVLGTIGGVIWAFLTFAKEWILQRMGA